MADQESVGAELNDNPSSSEATTETQPQLSQLEAATQESRENIVSPFVQPSHDTMPSASGSAEIEDSNLQGVAASRPEDPAASKNPPAAVLEALPAAQEFVEGREHIDYLPLYRAANKGDWKTAKSFIDRYPSALTARITENSMTILMVAAEARKWKFVEKLVEILPPKSLAMRDVFGFTALHFVAIGGSLKTAKALIEKNRILPQIPDVDGNYPLFFSLDSKCKELVCYLISVTENEHPFTGPESVSFIVMLIDVGFHDIALYLVRRYPGLAVSKDKSNGISILSHLSSRCSDFLSGSKLAFWERWIYKLVRVKVRLLPRESALVNMEYLGNAEYTTDIAVPIQQRSFLTRVLQRIERLLWKAIKQLAPPLQHIREAKLNHLYLNELVDYLCAQISAEMNSEEIIKFLHGQPPVLWNATELGVIEIVRALLHYFPSLINVDKESGHKIFQGAIQSRQPKIFNLITTEMSIIARKWAFSKDASGNAALHLAAKLPPSGTSTDQFLSVSGGAAFQMQRELQWFEEVKKVAPPLCSTVRNGHNLTPKELFRREHKDLADKAEKWMKDMANAGVIVTTLITTVVLTAVSTVPGGNSDKGIPNFLDRISFFIFVVSDALAVFSSATSLLVFLSILTARYAQEDFLRVLPRKLIIALGSLFLAIATMMVAFGASLTIIVAEKWHSAYIPIILLASVPGTVFVMLQLPLFIHMINSTYGHGVFGS